MRRRDDKHLQFLRSLICVVCYDNTSVEAAHIRYADPRIAKPITGNSIKPDDQFCLPVCGKHHREQHLTNERRFWEQHRIDPILLALALYAVSGDAQESERIIKFHHLSG